MKKTPIIIVSIFAVIIAVFIAVALVVELDMSSADEVIVMLFLFEFVIIGLLYILVQKYLKSTQETHTKVVGEEQVQCNVCGTINKKRKSYCKHCNSSLLVIVCPVCKEVNKYDEKFCVSCDSILQNNKRHV